MVGLAEMMMERYYGGEILGNRNNAFTLELTSSCTVSVGLCGLFCGQRSLYAYVRANCRLVTTFATEWRMRLMRSREFEVTVSDATDGRAWRGGGGERATMTW